MQTNLLKRWKLYTKKVYNLDVFYDESVSFDTPSSEDVGKNFLYIAQNELWHNLL